MISLKICLLEAKEPFKGYGKEEVYGRGPSEIRDDQIMIVIDLLPQSKLFVKLRSDVFDLLVNSKAHEAYNLLNDNAKKQFDKAMKIDSHYEEANRAMLIYDKIKLAAKFVYTNFIYGWDYDK